MLAVRQIGRPAGVGADGGLGQVSSSNSGKERWDPVTSLKVSRLDVEKEKRVQADFSAGCQAPERMSCLC